MLSESQAGPTVATIFVRRNMGAPGTENKIAVHLLLQLNQDYAPDSILQQVIAAASRNATST
jgi:hypothetical protein